MLARYSQACPAAIICSSSHWCSGYHVSKNMFASDSNACAPTSFAAERIARRCSAHLCSCSHWCSGKHVSNNMFASDSNACAPTRIAAERTARRCSALFPPCSRQLGCPLCLWRLRNAKHHSFWERISAQQSFILRASFILNVQRISAQRKASFILRASFILHAQPISAQRKASFILRAQFCATQSIIHFESAFLPRPTGMPSFYSWNHSFWGHISATVHKDALIQLLKPFVLRAHFCHGPQGCPHSTLEINHFESTFMTRPTRMPSFYSWNLHPGSAPHTSFVSLSGIFNMWAFPATVHRGALCNSYNGNVQYTCIGLAKTIYIRCIHGIFGREITRYTVIYGVYIRFWPTLHMYHSARSVQSTVYLVSRVGQSYMHIVE